MYKIYCNYDLPKQARDLLTSDYQLVCYDNHLAAPRDEIKKHIKDADGFIVKPKRINKDLLDCADKLKVVSTVSVGYDHFDIEEMKAHGVIGTHTPNVLNDAVADTVFGLALAVARKIPMLDTYIKSKKWLIHDHQSHFGVDMHHKKMGIIGLGRIGTTIARRAKFGFDMEVSYHNLTQNEQAEKELGVYKEPLDQLLKTSDYVVLMLPYNTQTKDFMDLEKFKMMKSSAIFINASRGQTVVEHDLIKALNEDMIYGAGLDVYCQEPLPVDHPFLACKNVVMLPHAGTSTEDVRTAMAVLATQNTMCVLEGKEVPAMVPEFRSV